MGYDLYGVSPVMREVSKDKYPIYNKYVNLEWDERKEAFEEDDAEERFYAEMTLREEENPGTYFRNNVWWWRRLWQFTCMECDDFLDGEDIKAGDSNSGHVITEEKASAMAKRLQEKIDDGTAAHYENEIKLDYEQCEKDEHGDPKDFDMMYPFSVGHLQDFILFCSESGGFQIGQTLCK